MAEHNLKKRTKVFALNIIRMSEILPRNRAADVIAKQLIRSATSVGANYLAARSGKSRADFACKLIIVEEEILESQYWLELLTESGLVKKEPLNEIIQEASELSTIFIASNKSTRAKKPNAD